MKPNVFAVKREIDDWGIWYAIWLNGWSNLWTIWVAVAITRHDKKLVEQQEETNALNWTRT